MKPLQQTERTRVRRLPQRGAYDRQAIYPILDEALVAHVGFVDASHPYVLPMAFVRFGDAIFLHGSNRARMLEQIAAGDPVCVTATLLDGLVLARSAFHHSMNYRSVAVLGRGRAVEDRDRMLTALEALTEKLTPGRWAAIREPTDQELKATRVVEIPIEEASAKIRTGPPLDDEEDLALPVWAGCVPIVRSFGEPEADPTLASSIPLPAHVTNLTRSKP